MSEQIADLTQENARLREVAAAEQSARVALEGVVNDRLDEILKLLKRGRDG